MTIFGHASRFVQHTPYDRFIRSSQPPIRIKGRASQRMSKDFSGRNSEGMYRHWCRPSLSNAPRNVCSFSRCRNSTNRIVQAPFGSTRASNAPITTKAPDAVRYTFLRLAIPVSGNRSLDATQPSLRSTRKLKLYLARNGSVAVRTNVTRSPRAGDSIVAGSGTSLLHEPARIEQAIRNQTRSRALTWRQEFWMSLRSHQVLPAHMRRRDARPEHLRPRLLRPFRH